MYTSCGSLNNEIIELARSYGNTHRRIHDLWISLVPNNNSLIILRSVFYVWPSFKVASYAYAAHKYFGAEINLKFWAKLGKYAVESCVRDVFGDFVILWGS